MHILEAALVSNLGLRPRSRNVPLMADTMTESPRLGADLAARFVAAIAVIGIFVATLDMAT